MGRDPSQATTERNEHLLAEPCGPGRVSGGGQASPSDTHVDRDRVLAENQAVRSRTGPAHLGQRHAVAPSSPVGASTGTVASRRTMSMAGASPSARSIIASKDGTPRSEEHTSELQSLMRTSYAVFCLTKKNT